MPVSDGLLSLLERLFVISTIIDFILHIDQHLAALSAEYGVWIYAILFLIIFCETGLVVTPFLPGDSLLFAAGGIAALGEMNIHLMVALLLVAAILGDAVNFAIGKYFGARLFANPDSKIFRRAYLDKTHAFYEKHGGKTIVLARFIPIIRTFAPFVAGVSEMAHKKFQLFNIVGAVTWVVLLIAAGYFLGNIPLLRDHLNTIVLLGVSAAIVPLILSGAWKLVKKLMV